MATFTESFNKADSATLGPDLTWYKAPTAEPGDPDCGLGDGAVHSNAFAVNGGDRTGCFYTTAHAYDAKCFARAEHAVGSAEMYTQAVVSAIGSHGIQTAQQFAVGVRCLTETTPTVTQWPSGFWFILSRITGIGGTPGTWTAQIIAFNADAAGTYFKIVASVADALAADALDASPTIRLEAEGSTYTGKVNGVTVVSGTFSASGWAEPIAETGQRGGLGIFVNRGTPGLQAITPNVDKLESFETGTITADPLPVEVPYMVGNERGQVLACVNAGSSTGEDHPTPEWRYWYSGPPTWAEGLAGEEPGSLPAWYATDENGEVSSGRFETQLVELPADYEGLIVGVVVHYVPRPGLVLDGLDGGGVTTAGFSAVLEGYAIPDLVRVDADGRDSGVVSSSDDSPGYGALSFAADEQASDLWPNARTVFLPAALEHRVQLVRASLRIAQHVEIKAIQIVGRATVGRNT